MNVQKRNQDCWVCMYPGVCSSRGETDCNSWSVHIHCTLPSLMMISWILALCFIRKTQTEQLCIHVSEHHRTSSEWHAFQLPLRCYDRRRTVGHQGNTQSSQINSKWEDVPLRGLHFTEVYPVSRAHWHPQSDDMTVLLLFKRRRCYIHIQKM